MMEEVVTVPVVATFVLPPPSMFQDAALWPVPAPLLYTPLDDTVVELPESYQLSEVDEVVP